jgi:hypothetical protein
VLVAAHARSDDRQAGAQHPQGISVGAVGDAARGRLDQAVVDLLGLLRQRGLDNNTAEGEGRRRMTFTEVRTINHKRRKTQVRSKMVGGRDAGCRRGLLCRKQAVGGRGEAGCSEADSATATSPAFGHSFHILSGPCASTRGSFGTTGANY